MRKLVFKNALLTVRNCVNRPIHVIQEVLVLSIQMIPYQYQQMTSLPYLHYLDPHQLAQVTPAAVVGMKLLVIKSHQVVKVDSPKVGEKPERLA